MKRLSPLLLELIAMVLIFSLCAAVCMRVLSDAWSVSRSSERLTQAVALAETAAARLQSEIPYHGGATGEYTVVLEETPGDSGLTDTLISVKYEEELIYTLTVTLEELP